MQLKSAQTDENGNAINQELNEDASGETITAAELAEPIFKEFSISAEFNYFIRQQLPGVYIIPSSRNPHEWFGVLFVRQGLYQGAIFRFMIIIPDNFPDDSQPPKLIFDIPVFHPLVSPQTRELDVKRAFPHWTKHVHHISHVVAYMQRIFYRIETQDPLNPQAARLYENQQEQFRLRVADSVRQSREIVYDPPESSDPHAIRFSPWDTGIHESIRKNIFNRIACNTYHQPSVPDTSVVTPGDFTHRTPSSVDVTSFAVNNSVVMTSSTQPSTSTPGGRRSDDSSPSSAFPQNAQTSGLSWFDPDRFQIMAAPDKVNQHAAKDSDKDK